MCPVSIPARQRRSWALARRISCQVHDGGGEDGGYNWERGLVGVASMINGKRFPGDGSGTLDTNMPGTGVASGSTLYVSTRLAGTYVSILSRYICKQCSSWRFQQTVSVLGTLKLIFWDTTMQMQKIDILKPPSTQKFLFISLLGCA